MDVAEESLLFLPRYAQETKRGSSSAGRILLFKNDNITRPIESPQSSLIFLFLYTLKNLTRTETTVTV